MQGAGRCAQHSFQWQISSLQAPQQQGWEGGKEGAVAVAQRGLQQKRQMSRHLIRNKTVRDFFTGQHALAFKAIIYSHGCSVQDPAWPPFSAKTSMFVCKPLK